MAIGRALCFFCTRLNRETAESCEAFDVIPEKFLSGESEHREPIYGDGGLTFDPMPTAEYEGLV